MPMQSYGYRKKRRKLRPSAVILTLGALICLFLLLVVLLHPDRRADWDGAVSADRLVQAVDARAVIDYAEQYGVSTAYLMQVLPGYLVFQDHGTYIFQPIDESLGLHDYDWNDLYYEQDGQGQPARIGYRSGDRQARCGVDVSYFQGEIDWPAVAADGISFAFVRLGYRGYTDGSLFTDAFCQQNLSGAAAAGLEVGAYFFSQAITPAEAEEEAELALSLLAGHTLSLPVVFDLEEVADEAARTNGLSTEQRTQISRAFCERIAEAGYQPMLYGNLCWLAARVDRRQLAEYPVWFVQYAARPLYPYRFDFWQYTDCGTVAGISTDVDLNLWFAEE